jgi:hypothetical protein
MTRILGSSRSAIVASHRVRRRQDDDGAPRPPDPSLRNHRNRQRELALQTPRLSATPACPGGQTGTSHARRSVAREGTARRARDPPVRYRDKPAPTPVRGPFSMPIRGPDCLPFDLTHRPQAWGALQQRHYLAVPNPQTADRAVGGRAALSFAAAAFVPAADRSSQPPQRRQHPPQEMCLPSLRSAANLLVLLRLSLRDRLG